MNRSSTIRSKGSTRTLVLILGLALTCLLPLANADERPNVLFIAIDDLNDWVGCFFWYEEQLNNGGIPDWQAPDFQSGSE